MANMRDTNMKEVVEQATSSLKPQPFGRAVRDKHWAFDPDWLPLNHGSFGTSPLPVSDIYHHYNRASERRPCQYIKYAYPVLLNQSRAVLADFLNVPMHEVVYVPNATTGINTVLRNLDFQPGEKIAYFDFIYGACGHSIQYITETTNAEALKISVTLPATPDEILAAFEAAIEPHAGKVKVALFDTVTSMPAVRLPFERLVSACKKAGVLSLIDGAHGIGLVPLDLKELDADFLTSNLHKWLFTPRGCAFLHVPKRNQHLIRSTTPTSWGFVPHDLSSHHKTTTLKCTDGDDDQWADMFSFVGTTDGSGYLCAPAALEFRQKVFGGEENILNHLNEFARKAGRIFSKTLGEGADIMDPGTAQTAMVNIRLPISRAEVGDHADDFSGWITEQMVEHQDTYIAVFEYAGSWWTRVSAQVYLEEADLVKGAGILKALVEKVKSGEWKQPKTNGVTNGVHSSGIHTNGVNRLDRIELEVSTAVAIEA